MKLDPARMVDKCGYINQQVAELRELVSGADGDSVLHDPWMLKGVKYSLQTAIEACIDLAYHVCARHFGYAPRDARDAMIRLAEARLISNGDLRKYSAMIGFRNRVVHGYQEVNTEQIRRIIAEDLDDVQEFTNIMLSLAGQ
jgi:uncharacterized protein YutE (UPF0331/DUF86 family)